MFTVCQSVVAERALGDGDPALPFLIAAPRAEKNDKEHSYAEQGDRSEHGDEDLDDDFFDDDDDDDGAFLDEEDDE